MTRQRSFKRLVRMRMEKTGERYAAARASLLAADEPKATDAPTLTVSDEVIRRRTGRGWGGVARPPRRLGRDRQAASRDRPLARVGARD